MPPPGTVYGVTGEGRSSIWMSHVNLRQPERDSAQPITAASQGAGVSLEPGACAGCSGEGWSVAWNAVMEHLCYRVSELLLDSTPPRLDEPFCLTRLLTSEVARLLGSPEPRRNERSLFLPCTELVLLFIYFGLSVVTFGVYRKPPGEGRRRGALCFYFFLVVLIPLNFLSGSRGSRVPPTRPPNTLTSHLPHRA